MLGEQDFNRAEWLLAGIYQMANYVKISTIGPLLLGDNSETGQAAVDRMIEFWDESLAQVLPDRPDLILVPEACDRYSLQSPVEQMEFYGVRGNQVRDFFAEMAREHQCYIAYAAIREVEDGSWRNSIQLLGRDGALVGIYDKNHPTVLELEWGIVPGREAPIFECDFGSVGGAICFDLNFDDIRLKYVQSRPDLLLFPSMYHGGLMQGYWAYSTLSHLVTSIATSRRFQPPSAVISPVGHVLATTTNYFDFVTTTVNLDCFVVHLDFNRDRIKTMKDRHGPGVSVFDPGNLAAVLISSEAADLTGEDLIEEFGFELLDDYLARSLSIRHSARD